MSGLELAGLDKLSTIAALVKRLTLSRGVLRFAISLVYGGIIIWN
jgi:hypothetical protein